MLAELNNLADGPLAESFADADRNPPVFDPDDARRSRCPSRSRSRCAALVDGEWYRLSLPAELGGFGIPPSVAWAAAELILGANPAVFMYMAGPDVRRRSCTATAPTSRSAGPRSFIDRDWGATMVLTEPDAGSDVGAAAPRPCKQDDGSWHLDGVKRFITVRRPAT